MRNSHYHKNMGYYSRHAIFLMDNDIQKLKTIQKLLEDKDIYFVIRKQTVYLETGEPLRIPCISDVNWNSGMGYKWYDFDYDMQAVSELFNEQFPDVQILVYEKTEDEFEILHTFLAGERLHYDDVIHYQKELEKVCKSLNKRGTHYRIPYYKVASIAHHPTIVFHGGAYTFIGYIVFELYEDCWRFSLNTPRVGHGCQNYNFLPERIKAMQLLNEYLLSIRDAGKLREVAIPRPRRQRF